jgi:hypothetical protein
MTSDCSVVWQARYYDFNVWSEKKFVRGNRIAMDGAAPGAGWRLPHCTGALSRGKPPAQAELGRGTLGSKMNAIVWATRRVRL